ncbi:MAG: STAS domain-containing protein [Betaproteobacteria bacterium]|nr:MAG: STAS domain-containing protein [Betaproteobacteria bacterium]
MRREGQRIVVSGPVTLANVARVLEDGYTQIRDGADAVDLAGVTELDSSLLAMLLAWLREARRLGRGLEFANLPQGLATIARLYGVVELLPPAQTQH